MHVSFKMSLSLFSVFLLTVFIVHAVKARRLCHDNCELCSDGVCTECYYGYWGPTCQKPCVNCWLAGCDKHTGRCIQCKPGQYSDECSKPCPYGCRASYDKVKNCQRETGKCLEGCSEGLWGQICETKCSVGCSGGSCYQHDGGCTTECKAGWFGRSCACNQTCLNGTCDNGVCTGVCQDGWTGKSCNEQCHENCFRCDKNTKTCFSCKSGLYGQQCMLECSSNCIGYYCDVTGRCVKGCKGGFHGISCELPCPSNCLECEQDTDICSKCKVGFTGPSCTSEEAFTLYNSIVHSSTIQPQNERITKPTEKSFSANEPTMTVGFANKATMTVSFELQTLIFLEAVMFYFFSRLTK